MSTRPSSKPASRFFALYEEMKRTVNQGVQLQDSLQVHKRQNTLTPISTAVYQAARLRIIIAGLDQVTYGKLIDLALCGLGLAGALHQRAVLCVMLGGPRGLVTEDYSADARRLKDDVAVGHLVNIPALVVANLAPPMP
jgi:hypothetical protein